MERIFTGDKKVGKSILSPAEDKLKFWAVPRIPKCIETYHLTLMTIAWSVMNIILGFYSREDHRVLWLVSIMIVFQYLTDLFDGELGRQRNTGLVKWGFYMDHFLDHLFLCSLVFVGYMISPQGLEIWYFLLRYRSHRNAVCFYSGKHSGYLSGGRVFFHSSAGGGGALFCGANRKYLADSKNSLGTGHAGKEAPGRMM